jgi:Family of unknown function (DUF6498)
MRRLRSLTMIAAANGLVIFWVLYFEWTLLEATLAYIGEFLILGLVNSARFLAASRLPPSQGGSRASAWKLRGAKAVNGLMSITMCSLFCSVPLGTLFVTGALGEEGSRLMELWRPLAWCWAGFVVTHAVAFVSMARQGAYRVLIEDGRVNALIWRFVPLVAAAIACAGEAHGALAAPWFFVTIMAAMAVLDTVTCMVDLDADEAAIGGRESP